MKLSFHGASALVLLILMGPTPAALAQEADLSEHAINSAEIEAWQDRTRSVEEETQQAAAALAAGDPDADADADADAEDGEGEGAPAATPNETQPDESTSVEEVIEDQNKAEAEVEKPKEPDPFLVRMQILLDRAHVSPGVIDGFAGDNLSKAIRAFEEQKGLRPDGEPDAEVWAALSADTAPAVTRYRITAEDLKARFVKSIPEDYAKLAEMKWLGYHGPAEMLAERFHLDEDLLRAMNPEADFDKEGTEILVPALGSAPQGKVTRIVVDKSDGELRGFDEGGALLVAFPATIGSKDTPSPSGEVQVEVVVHDPDYTYDPKVNFQQGDNKEALRIPPGPNGPVGNIWIDLSKPTYGIHGTPEPALVSKAASHGCVRLTNWDAALLADLVEPKKTQVVFQE